MSIKYVSYPSGNLVKKKKIFVLPEFKGGDQGGSHKSNIEGHKTRADEKLRKF